MELREGGRGDFLVTADDACIWDKKRRGDFPDEDQIVEVLRAMT